MKKKTKITLAIIAIIMSIGIFLTATITTATGVMLFTPAGKFISTAVKNTTTAIFSRTDADAIADKSEEQTNLHPWKYSRYGKTHTT